MNKIKKNIELPKRLEFKNLAEPTIIKSTNNTQFIRKEKSIVDSVYKGTTYVKLKNDYGE